jgi:hypothetical protein
MLFLKIFNRIEIFIWGGGDYFSGNFKNLTKENFVCVCSGGTGFISLDG